VEEEQLGPAKSNLPESFVNAASYRATISWICWADGRCRSSWLINTVGGPNEVSESGCR
jgi:hypothetical protein